MRPREEKTCISAEAAFWARQWRQKRQSSPLRRNQRMHPDRWEAFYKRVAPIWSSMTGVSRTICDEIVRFLLGKEVVQPGQRALDVGCGSGHLALAMACQGIRVTAVDRCEKMIRTLEEKIANAEKELPLHSVVGDWRRYAPVPVADLVVACFFPDVLSLAGLQRLETLAVHRCLLVLGQGEETFPLRKRIWEKVMDVPIANGRFHVTCAQNYLSAIGRCPSLGTFATQARLDEDADLVRSFYQAYFGIFGKKGPGLDRAIAGALAPYCHRGRIRVSGKCRLAFVWWKPAQSHNPVSGNRILSRKMVLFSEGES